MTLPEGMIMDHLEWLLTSSQPGSMLHHLVVARVPAAGLPAGPLGLADGSRVATSVTAVLPDGPVVQELIASAVLSAGREARAAGERVEFAALSEEAWVLADDADGAGRRLLEAGRPLGEHPRAEEVTVVYGACRDGRRWRGRRFVSGPRAGERHDVDLLVGRVRAGESRGVAAEALIRSLVGLL